MASNTAAFGATANVGKLIGLFAKQYEANPKVVLRELIQNASDTTTQALKAEADHVSRIEVEILPPEDRDRRSIQLAVKDWGMGMNLDGLQNYLARLGEGSKEDDLDTIGQWGIGFFAIVVTCPSAIIATKTRDGEPLVYKYTVESSEFTKVTGELATWITGREFGNEAGTGRESGTTILLNIDSARFPTLKDWFVKQRLVTELRTFCLLVPHPIFVRDGATGDTEQANVSGLPWTSTGPERQASLQAIWAAVLPYTEEADYPQLVHCFSRKEDDDAEFSGILYFIKGYGGGTAFYYKSMFVEQAMDMLPSWANGITVLLNARTGPKSPKHLDVPPSRTLVVRNDAFFRILPLLEEEASSLITDAVHAFRGRLQGALSDPEQHSEAVKQVTRGSLIIDALGGISEVNRNICTDLANSIAEALAGDYSDQFYKDRAVELFSARTDAEVTRDNIVGALQVVARIAEKNAGEERQLQRANKKPPTWYPDESRRFIHRLGRHMLVTAVIKEYPFGRTPRFAELRLPLSCVGLLDSALLDPATSCVRIPLLTRGEASEYLYSAEQDRVVVVAAPAEVLLLMCVAQHCDDIALDLVHSGRSKFKEIDPEEDWAGVVGVLQGLAHGHAAGAVPGATRVCDVVDVAGYDQTELPLILHQVDGQTHLTVNAWNRGMKYLNQLLNRAAAQGMVRTQTALGSTIHELYHSALFRDDAGPGLDALHRLEVRQEEIIGLCDLLGELFDLRSVKE